MSSIKTKSKFIFLSWYQIIGGILGLAFLILAIENISAFNSLLLVIFIPAFLLFAFSILSGIILFKNDLRGLRLSLINQILQVISVFYLGYAFQYISGVYFTIGLDLTNGLNFTFNIGVSAFNMAIHTDSNVIQVNFNLVAFFLIIIITKLIKQIKKEQSVQILTEIGK